ncbi:MAG: NAD-dependent epimerase/dehydratase family protein, partial [Anaerolineales bacterium]|nr:NAD-dependent epimerase/dehydratase family protein [Anaerolineales bacterium]
MKKYLLTGAAGFIASVVAKMLLEQGAEVVGLDNLNQAYDVRMKEYRLAELSKLPGFSFHKLDVSDRSLLQDNKLTGQGFDAVINLAARAGVRDSLEDPWVYLETNATGTLNLLELCRQENINKFLLASTAGLYGDDAVLPTPETSATDRPLQAYAASKKAAEALAHAYHYLYGIDITIVRYFNVYGPAGRPDSVMFRFVKWIQEEMPVHLNGDGGQSRGFTYVEDIARGTISALQPLGFEIINLGGHELMTINTLIKSLEEITGNQSEIVQHPRHPADILTSQADVSKAKSLLDWEPQVSLEEGIGKVVEWYLKEQSWAKDIKT